MTFRVIVIVLSVVALVALVLFVYYAGFADNKDMAGALGNVVGGILGGVLAAFAAYLGVKETLERQRAADDKTSADELNAVRTALHTEIAMLAKQCAHEVDDWLDAAQRDIAKDPRTAMLPPLRAYHGLVNQLGRLTRAEAVTLIGFSGSLDDSKVFAEGLSRKNFVVPEDKKMLALIFSNACGHAAGFLEAVPTMPKSDADLKFIERLKWAFSIMGAERGDRAHASD